MFLLQNYRIFVRYVRQHTVMDRIYHSCACVIDDVTVIRVAFFRYSFESCIYSIVLTQELNIRTHIPSKRTMHRSNVH